MRMESKKNRQDSSPAGFLMVSIYSIIENIDAIDCLLLDEHLLAINDVDALLNVVQTLDCDAVDVLGILQVNSGLSGLDVLDANRSLSSDVLQLEVVGYDP